jgi:hypothetical protein
MVYFKVLLNHTLEVTGKQQKFCQGSLYHGRDSNLTPPIYKYESLPLAWLDIKGCISFFLYAYVFCQQYRQIELHLCYIIILSHW